nr:MAG TPA: hypothetical protein [Caudoviricetes sp.]
MGSFSNCNYRYLIANSRERLLMRLGGKHSKLD